MNQIVVGGIQMPAAALGAMANLLCAPGLNSCYLAYSCHSLMVLLAVVLGRNSGFRRRVTENVRAGAWGQSVNEGSLGTWAL